MQFIAKYFDGNSARAWTVAVLVTPEDIRIHDIIENGSAGLLKAVWRTQDLHLVHALSPGQPVVVGCGADARLVIDHDSGAAFVAAAGDSLRRDEWLSVRWAALAGWLAAAAGVVAVIALAVPLIARVLAPHAPLAWRQQLWRYVVQSISAGHRVCTSPAGTAALNAMIARLAAAAHAPAVNASVVDVDTVNAFAAPGGYIVILRGIIDKAQTPDELAGVIAHELGHVVQEHPTSAVLRMFGLGFALRAMGGGEGSVGSATAIYSLSYNRKDELEADQIAVRTMQGAGLDSQALVALFKRLGQGQGSTAGINRYLSSHPGMADRIAAISSANAPVSADPARAEKPILTADQWAALKGICGLHEGILGKSGYRFSR